MMKKVLEVFLIIWQLPQIVLGYLLKVITKAEFWEQTSEEYGVDIYGWKLKSSISLSKYFILVRKLVHIDTIKHEKGHAIQSLYLGPLYLIVIGLPSIIWAGLIYKHTKKSYYWFYTEAWADRLGRVPKRINEKI